MTNLFQCSRCSEPFVAPDERLIAQRNGRCPDCTKAEILESFGLPADFLIRRLGPA